MPHQAPVPASKTRGVVALQSAWLPGTEAVLWRQGFAACPQYPGERGMVGVLRAGDLPGSLFITYHMVVRLRPLNRPSPLRVPTERIFGSAELRILKLMEHARSKIILVSLERFLGISEGSRVGVVVRCLRVGAPTCGSLLDIQVSVIHPLFTQDKQPGTMGGRGSDHVQSHSCAGRCSIPGGLILILKRTQNLLEAGHLL